MEMKRLILGIATLSVLALSCTRKVNSNAEEKVIPEPELAYGLPVDSFFVIKEKIGKQLFAEILLPHGIGYPTIDRIAKTDPDIFDVRRLNSEKNYSLFCTNDSAQIAQYFIYENDPINYVVVDMRDSIQIYRGQKEVEVRERMASGVISSSLWNTLRESKLSPALVMEMSQIYAWTIDFFRIQKGDRFKVIFEEKFVEGEFVGIGKVKAVEFIHMGDTCNAFFFEDEFGDYFDEEGNNLRRAFLKAPVEYSRISSRYQKRRFHPVLKRYKSHLGTDYAAPHGTPIVSTADGIVIAAAYTSGNGNYVKVRHNSTYTTQYLHMSKFASGIRNGIRVRQGQVIGYVGSTGLASGPHVCYRFWKHGVQVDPFGEDLPAADPISPENASNFMLLQDSLRVIIQDIPYPDEMRQSSEAELAAVVQ
jgi:murein DD-endopeptidase MepM/ murein hydrolase activator NlpD